MPDLLKREIFSLKRQSQVYNVFIKINFIKNDLNKNIFNKGRKFMFIGRKKELKVLEDSYQRNGFSMTVITGRRRIGKSTLIREFTKDKKALYYTATKVGSERNLELLADQVISLFAPALKGIQFKTTENLFDFITARLDQEKLVFIIDELPYWAESDQSLLSVLQKYIDTKWNDKKMHLILCGSSLSFMENEVLSEKSPLFGRRDSQIHLEPFSYLEAAEFVPDYSYEDKAITYGVTGGVAKYLSLFNPEESLDDNIKRLFFTAGGYLYDEPHNLLTQEFTDIVIVNNIIEQIAAGENTLALIADKVHESSSTVSYSIRKLINTGIVKKKLCIGEEKNKKKFQYVLKDTMFQFWYEFIPDAVSLIEMGRGTQYYDKVVKDKLHDYMGGIFEEMCRTFTLMKGSSGEEDYFLTNVGTWWGTEILRNEDGSKYMQTADIDVVGVSDVDKVIVVGECKFKNRKMNESVYDTLVRRSKYVPVKYRVAEYLFFSLSGFTDWNVHDNVKCYTLKDLYEQAV